MSLKTQAKVLRSLEEQAFERVGGKDTIKVDVRVIAASNRDLPALIREGRFREDLYYRLNVIPIEVPALRTRRDDIPALVGHFVHQFCAENGKRAKTLSIEAMGYFLAYDWPGNVRELRNMTVTVAGPPTLIPPYVQELGAKVSYRLEDAIGDVDVIMMLRLQQERMTAGLIPSLREYSRYWGLALDRLAKHARPDVLIMHPGPVNRGVELSPEVADGPYSLILDQVSRGVAVRMGVLLLLAGRKGGDGA